LQAAADKTNSALFAGQAMAAGAHTLKETADGKFSMANVARRAKYLSKGAGKGISKMSNKLLDLPILKPLKEMKQLATILIVIMVVLLLISIICFFRSAILWGILGILVDVGVGVGLYFGIQAAPTKAKLFGIAGIAVTGAMLMFCFVRMIMGR